MIRAEIPKAEIPKAIAHLNFVGFRAAVAALEDRALRGRPYAIAGSGGRSLVWDVSREALDEGVKPGMALAAAERLVKGLAVIPPNPAACQKANGVLEKVIARYAPAWQNDGAGNIYLDLTGTGKLFGPAADCLCRVVREINEKSGLAAAAASAANKLTCKVASRAIRPLGLVEIPNGNEAAFLAHQNVALLPGLGPSLMRIIAVTGFKEIGEIAALADGEALSLFGKKGLFLRDAARGIDDSPVEGGRAGRVIERRADFPEDVIDEEIVRGAFVSLVEHAGLEMRNDKLGMRTLRLLVVYSDGLELQGVEKSRRLLSTDCEILKTVESLYKKTAVRRIRIRSVCLSFEDLSPLGYEPDLFVIESEAKDRRLQAALDLIRGRYGAEAVTRGAVLAAKRR